METNNPYQSPQAASESALSDQQIPKGGNLAWLLLSFEGRIPRSTFWKASIVATLTVSIAGTVIDSATQAIAGRADFVGSMLLISPLYISFIWISLALQIKRWHDRDKSGWWVLIGLIPIVGPILALVETGVLRGTQGQNRFGADSTPDKRLVGLSLLRHNQAIHGEVVEMDGTDATDEDLAGLIGNSEIKELRLGGTGIIDVGLEHCSGLNSLEILDLSMTRITDKGIESLKGLHNLTTLWLGGTRISDAGLLKLTVLDRLKNIYAKNTDVTAEGARRFSDSLAGCTVHI